MYFIKLTKPKMLIIILSLKNLAEKMNKQLIKKFNTARVNMLTTMNTYFMGELANKGILTVFDLNISEANIIFYLFNNQREFSISEIIESQRISKFTTSRAVKKLVNLGLIERYQKSDNMRVSYIKLTPKGQEICNADGQNALYEYNFLFDKICTEDELQQVIDNILNINSVLSRIEAYSVSQLKEELQNQNSASDSQ